VSLAWGLGENIFPVGKRCFLQPQMALLATWCKYMCLGRCHKFWVLDFFSSIWAFNHGRYLIYRVFFTDLYDGVLSCKCVRCSVLSGGLAPSRNRRFYMRIRVFRWQCLAVSCHPPSQSLNHGFLRGVEGDRTCKMALPTTKNTVRAIETLI